MKKLGFIAAICLGIVLAGSCGGSKEGLEPSAIITEFYSALASMKFDKAAEYCTQDSMCSYIDGYKKVYDTNQAKDKKATEAAEKQLAGIVVTVTETIKDKETRTVLYSLADIYGDSKDKTAILTKVEGEWKIAEIKDR